MKRTLTILAALATLTTPAVASATPGDGTTHVGTTAADVIACWLPQPGWTPADPATLAPTMRAGYADWLATSVRQRTRDGMWEVITHTDRGTAPMCREVLPGVWVAVQDVPAVQAYLVEQATKAAQ